MRRLFIVFDETNLTQYQINTLNEETSIEVICINHAPVKLKCNYIFINDIDFLFKVQHMNINFDNINFILLVDNIKTDLFKAGKNILILHRFLIKYNVMEILNHIPIILEIINESIRAMFIDIKKKHIYYFDSYGDKIPTRLMKFVRMVRKQARHLGEKFTFKQTSRRHQYLSTECGMYSLFFIISLLEGKPIEYFDKRVTDKYMRKLRSIYFNKR